MTSLILALALTAPGDIYRCVAEDGSVQFQGRPCEGEQIGAIRSRAAGSERRLREWLNELPPGAARAEASPAPTASLPAASDYPMIELPARPTDPHSLSQCSEQFLGCASDDEATMDRCVASISHCGGAGGDACCNTSFVERYQTLRRHGFDRKSAARDALLGRQ